MLVQKVDLSAAGKKVSLSMIACFDLCVRLRGAPNCPYFGLPCRNFYINLASGVCCQDGLRCCWLPSWVTSVKVSIYAILKKDGKLYV